MPYCSFWLLYILVGLTTFSLTAFVCIIADNKFCINYCHWYLLFIFLSAALPMTTLIWTITIDNFQDTIIIKNFRMQVCKFSLAIKIHNTIALLQWTHFMNTTTSVVIDDFIHTIEIHKLPMQHCNTQFFMHCWYC